jgi:2',3'-cyclic-nucleotide 2'-phosphodiesterase/3'-nucleotidase
MFKRLSLVVLLLAAVILPSQAATTDAPRYYKLTILHSNDTHGCLIPFDWTKNKKRPLPFDSTDVGGLGRRSTLIRSLRQSASNPVLLVDVGDWVSTGGEMWDRFVPQMVADIEIMNLLQYDAGEPGNHEFQWGYPMMEKAWKASKYPWVCANLVDPKKNDALIFPPYVIKQEGALKVALMGLITVEAPLYEGAKNLKVLDPVEVTRQRVPEMLKQADIVIILSHLGVKYDKQVAEVPGVSAVIGGHDHFRFEEPILIDNGVETAQSLGKTPVVQASSWGSDLGQLDLTFRKGDDGVYRVVNCKGVLHPITPALSGDSAVDAIIKRFDIRAPKAASDKK